MFIQNCFRVSFSQGLYKHSSYLQVIRCMSSFKNKTVQLEADDMVCPQGIQGDNDANLQIWWKTCHRYGLENCDNKLENIQAGRKTSSEVLAEQNELIIQIAESYKKSKHSLSDYSTQGVQDSAVLSREQGRVIQSVVKQYKQQKRHYSTNTHSDQTIKQIDKKVEKLSQKQRLKLAVKDYGSTVIVFHICIYLMSLGGFYLAFSSGIDMVDILTRLGVGESILKMVSGAGTFVMALVVNKVLAPVRIAITLTSSPFIVRYLRQIGVLKVPKPK